MYDVCLNNYFNDSFTQSAHTSLKVHKSHWLDCSLR